MKNFSIAVLIIAIFSGCQSKEETPKEAANELATNILKLSDTQIKNAQLDYTSIVTKDIKQEILLSGTIDVPPQNLISVSAKMGGYLKSTHLLPGMKVNKGEVLAVMEDPTYIQLQEDYLSCKNRLSLAENEFRRQKELNQSKASSDKILQQSESAFIHERILLKSLSERLKILGINPERLTEDNISRFVNINSPVSGYVAKVNVNIGKYVTPSEIMFEVVDVSDIHLNLYVYEKDIPYLNVGQKVIAYSNQQPNKVFPGEIILVGHSLSEERMTEVHCHFEKYDRSLLPGMFMNAKVETAKMPLPTLPEDAIVRFENKQYVFVSKNSNTFEMVPVKTGASSEGFTVIEDTSALSNQKIVQNGAYTLLMSLKNKAEEE
jgi:cobalt-zinc-cadmium efflux system membrane fusion protein